MDRLRIPEKQVTAGLEGTAETAEEALLVRAFEVDDDIAAENGVHRLREQKVFIHEIYPLKAHR
jgi:hypothetical protein